MQKPTYVVATDLSPASRHAAEIAAMLAMSTNAALDFFCAVPASAARQVEFDLERAREALTVLAHSYADASVHVVVARDAAPAILSHVRRVGAALLVVAPHGVTGWKKVLLGSVTEKVLRGASTSVLIARGSGVKPLGKILVGVVPGPAGTAPLDAAISFSRSLEAELTVTHVVPPAPLLLPLVAPGARALRIGAKRLKAETTELERWVASFGARGVRLRLEVMVGSPAERLVGEARRRRADLVVVGATTRSAVRRALLGNVAHAVAGASPCSVLVVRARPGGR